MRHFFYRSATTTHMKNDSATLETQVFSAGFFRDTNLSAQSEAEARELGFGNAFGPMSRTRIVNRDGSFNVRREGSSLLGTRSVYHYCLSVSWAKFFLFIFTIYLAVNFAFAVLYFAAGPAALHGSNSTTMLARFLDCFFFSVQTFATIGYGRMSPDGILPNLLVTFEALVGLLGFALATGLFFARFSKPSARIVFSKCALIAPYRGIQSFQFRIANQRSNQLMHLEVRVILSRFEATDNGFQRKFYELDLERSQIVFFPLNWTIVHPIKPESPLFGLTEEELRSSRSEFLVLLEGLDDTFSQKVYAVSSYDYSEVVWGKRFRNILEDRHDGLVTMDLKRLDECDEAA